MALARRIETRQIRVRMGLQPYRKNNQLDGFSRRVSLARFVAVAPHGRQILVVEFNGTPEGVP
jgi:hypothetical protein